MVNLQSQIHEFADKNTAFNVDLLYCIFPRFLSKVATKIIWLDTTDLVVVWKDETYCDKVLIKIRLEHIHIFLTKTNDLKKRLKLKSFNCVCHTY